MAPFLAPLVAAALVIKFWLVITATVGIVCALRCGRHTVDRHAARVEAGRWLAEPHWVRKEKSAP